LSTFTARTKLRLLVSATSACALALVVAGIASASAPFNTQMPTITQEGNTLVLHNGGWSTNSGEVDRYVFRFTRNGALVKGPSSVPQTSSPDGHLVGEYPNDPQANVYQLQAAESGQFCGEVWGGTHSTYHYADGSLAYDLIEWGHTDLSGNPAKVCITIGEGGGGGSGSGSGGGGASGNSGVPAFTLAPGGLPAAIAGTPYATPALSATGGTPPYTYSVSSGLLPAGLTLSAAGVISGTPTRATSSPFLVEARDSTGRTTTRSYTIVVVWPNVAITPPELPAAVSGEPYSLQLVAVGGVGPYSFRLAEGMLPNGLSLAADGLLSGTPSARAGTFRIVVAVADVNGAPASIAYSLAVRAPTLTLTTALAAGRVGKAYRARLAVQGGTGPYRFVELDGSLPPGLSLSRAGVVRGVPKRAGTYRVRIRVYDENDASGDRLYRVLVRRR